MILKAKKTKKSRAHKTRLKHHITGEHKIDRSILKRHVTLFSLSIVVIIILLIQLVIYVIYTNRLVDRAQQVSVNQFVINSGDNTQKINSTLGFNLSYDKALFNVTASEIVSDGTLKTYDDNNLSDSRPFSIVEVIPSQTSGNPKLDVSRLNIITTNESNGVDFSIKPNQESLKKVAEQFSEKSDSSFDVVITSESLTSINGQSFLKQQYMSIPKLVSSSSSKLGKVQTVVYTTYANNRVYSLKVSGLNESDTTRQFDSIINSLNLIKVNSVSFEDKSNLDLTSYKSDNNLMPKNPIEHILGVGSASAEESIGGPGNITDIVARNAPAVVKIYNIACGSIFYLGQKIAQGCDGVQGSGFILSGDGYVATNGHVVSTSAKDVIYNSILYGPEILIKMLQVEGYSQQEIDGLIADVKSNPERIASVAAFIYTLTEEQLHFGKDDHKVHNVVALGNTIPKVKELFEGTISKIDDSEYVKNSKLIGSDFNSKDLISEKFSGSDVALLKMDGNNYPFVKLGSIGDVVQGSNITVIGFPGVADNELVDNESIEPTITKGVVSAIRDTNDTLHRVVQSDASISHGNSGGPAFSDSGKVFGIATYSFTSQQSGDSNISYMRDISDLTDLAKESNANFDQYGITQQAWDEGLDLFFKAHYSDAVVKFDQVKDIYPAHRLVGGYIDLAKNKIANGEDIKGSNMVVFIVAGILVASIGAVAGGVLMFKHKKRHNAYNLAYPGAANPFITNQPVAQPYITHQQPVVTQYAQPQQQYSNPAPTNTYSSPAPVYANTVTQQNVPVQQPIANQTPALQQPQQPLQMQNINSSTQNMPQIQQRPQPIIISPTQPQPNPQDENTNQIS